MFTIDFNANSKDEGRSSRSDIVIDVKGKGKFTVGIQTSYVGRERDTFTCKWDKVQLSKILPKAVVKRFEDDTCTSGTRKMDWWNPTEILTETLKKIGEVKVNNSEFTNK